MPTLPDELFSLIERLILAAREAAEEAANAAINILAVNRPEPYTSMNEDARQLRRTLRAKARQLGEGRQTEGLQPLIEEIAYQQWHRMLFARFLAENNLLMHPSGVAVSLQDCAELAPEEGEADAWAVAAKYASQMLPGIFRMEDPVVQIRFAPEGRIELERILAEIPEVAFTADDSLGWMYQFWQSKKKVEVNASERKIGGADLAPVTQLFTENYMVRFLLENSLGAWWAGKYPDSPLLKDYEYLRYKEDGTPAAGCFEGWPQTAAEVTVMDPCCGSGHFLVATFEMLCKMRMAEEGMDATEAGDAVIRDNIHGLEIDLRATQIAAFSVALIAWKTGGYREIPIPNIACSGIPVQGSLNSWLKLADKDDRLKRALHQLYNLFENAPTLGSLINPNQVQREYPLFTASYQEIRIALENVLTIENRDAKNEIGLFGATAINLTLIARLLASKYTLISTNVPYLTRGKQAEFLKEYCDFYHPETKSDLATAFVDRCRAFSELGGSYSILTPHYWLFLNKYKSMRKEFINKQEINLVARLGSGAFRAISGEVVNVSLNILTNTLPETDHLLTSINCMDVESIDNKIQKLINSEINYLNQLKQISNPNSTIFFEALALDKNSSLDWFGEYINSYTGIQTGDDPRYRRCFWEIRESNSNWRKYLNTVSETVFYGGREFILWWENDGEVFKNNPQAYIRGTKAWGKNGISVSQMGNLPINLYKGEAWIMNCASLIPKDPDNLLAIWAFCSSEQFNESVRKINQASKVNPGYFKKIPFDLQYWKEIAYKKFPDGLPEPYSNDPTQWLFEGHPTDSTDPLHVAVARLLGYHWPEQGKDELDTFSDEDGIVPLIPAGREELAADRLRTLLAAAYGEDWSPEKQRQLLAEADYTGKTLEEWLRDGFFKQHVKLFYNRPFIWHIWDGRKDGFQALVNYHKLDTGALDKLIYTYLGSWIELQRGHRNHGEPGADGRLVAALELKEKLEAIREGEPPYDIYVRWKTLAEQPIGWNPDLNDGVRLNIRPFVEAGVLRSKFTINWNKDRGKDPDGSERFNNLHYTNEEKRAARR